MTERERVLAAEVQCLRQENARLRKYERWYIVGDLRVRRADRQREKTTGRG